MPTFRQRPLTWLFLIASICVSLVLPSGGVDNPALSAMLFGQSFALGGWVTMGRAHRLMRGGGFIFGGIALASLATMKFAEPPHYPVAEAWAMSISGIAVLSGAAALMTLVWRMIIRRLPQSGRDEFEYTRWQFPLAELFGWTIVVAVASAVMRTAESLEADEPLFAMLIFAMVAALLMALFLDERRQSGPISILIAVAAVIAMFALLPILLSMFDRSIAIILAGAYAYVVLWIIVCRLDGRRAVEPCEPTQTTSTSDGFEER